MLLTFIDKSQNLINCTFRAYASREEFLLLEKVTHDVCVYSMCLLFTNIYEFLSCIFFLSQFFPYLWFQCRSKFWQRPGNIHQLISFYTVYPCTISFKAYGFLSWLLVKIQHLFDPWPVLYMCMDFSMLYLPHFMLVPW